MSNRFTFKHTVICTTENRLMYLLNRRQIELTMMLAIVCGCCTYQTAAAYQVDVFQVASNQFGGGASDFHSFDQSGSHLATVAIEDSQSALALATNNDVIFVGEYQGAINRYDLQGNFLGQFADVSRLAGPNTIGDFGPCGQSIETDVAGNVYSTFQGFQSDPRTAFRLDQSGAISETFSHPNLVFPTGIDADANGNVFILQGTSGKRLFEFDSSGNYVNDYELPATISPSDIAINEETNELLMYDRSDIIGAGSVHVYDLSTRPPVMVDTLPVPEMAIEVFVEQVSGRIFVATLDLGPPGTFVFRSDGFEVSREGELVASYLQDTTRNPTGSAIIAIPQPPTILGDVDQNGIVSFMDIAALVAILNTDTYLEEADCNEDGVVNFLDIAPFIAILSGN